MRISRYQLRADGSTYLKNFGYPIIEKYHKNGELFLSHVQPPSKSYFFRDLNQYIKEFKKGLLKPYKEVELNEYLDLWLCKDASTIEQGLFNGPFETKDEYLSHFSSDIEALDYVAFSALMGDIISDLINKDKRTMNYYLRRHL